MKSSDKYNSGKTIVKIYVNLGLKIKFMFPRKVFMFAFFVDFKITVASILIIQFPNFECKYIILIINKIHKFVIINSSQNVRL